MTRENLLFAIIGLLLGFIVGFMFASTMSQRSGSPSTAATAGTQNLPPDHPPTGAGAANGQGMQAEVTASLDKARKEPKNFEAQLKAAELYYQIQRFDESIEFLLKANQLRPDDYQTIAALGMVNLDANHYDIAEKWYKAAVVKKPDDVAVLSGLCAVALEQKKVKAAEDAIARLEKTDPTSQDLPQFREKLASLKSGDKPK